MSCDSRRLIVDSPDFTGNSTLALQSQASDYAINLRFSLLSAVQSSFYLFTRHAVNRLRPLCSTSPLSPLDPWSGHVRLEITIQPPPGLPLTSHSRLHLHLYVFFFDLGLLVSVSFTFLASGKFWTSYAVNSTSTSALHPFDLESSSSSSSNDNQHEPLRPG